MPLHNPDEKMSEGQGIFLWTATTAMVLGESIGFFGGYGSAMPTNIGLAVFFLILAIFGILVIGPVWIIFFRNVFKKVRK